MGRFVTNNISFRSLVLLAALTFLASCAPQQNSSGPSDNRAPASVEARGVGERQVMEFSAENNTQIVPIIQSDFVNVSAGGSVSSPEGSGINVGSSSGGVLSPAT